MSADLVPVDAGGTDGRDGWQEGDWEALLLAIKFGQCTPFVGAGASTPTLPLGGELAERWAKDDKYPFGDTRNLPRVAQYIAVTKNGNLPRLRVKKEFTGKGPPDFSAPGEIHGVVAQLPLPVYITTNYDNFMATALTDAGRQPVSEICPWRTAMKRRAVTDEPPKPFPKPSIASPVVYHLHGSLADIDSMVLTEDDYLDFLVAMSSVPDLVPPQIERAFSTSLLFLGYSLEDMNFKVLFRKLESFMSRTAGAVHVSVQLEPGKDRAPGTPLSKEEAASLVAQRNFLQKRLGLQRVAVYWGTCNDFAKDLGERWRQMSQ